MLHTDNRTRLAMWLAAYGKYRFRGSCSDFVTKVGSVVPVTPCRIEICMHMYMFLLCTSNVCLLPQNMKNASVKPWHLHMYQWHPLIRCRMWLLGFKVPTKIQGDHLAAWYRPSQKNTNFSVWYIYWLLASARPWSSHTSIHMYMSVAITYTHT